MEGVRGGGEGAGGFGVPVVCWREVCYLCSFHHHEKMASSDVGKVSSASLGAKINEIGVRQSEEHGRMSATLKFGFYYLTCHLLSILTYLIDHGFSCWLAYQYHTQGQETYFALTITFVIMPALISTGFSMRW